MGLNILTFLSVKGYNFNAWLFYPLCAIAMLILIVVFGVLESKSGITTYENQKNNSLNPDIMEIKEMLRELRNRNS